MGNIGITGSLIVGGLILLTLITVQFTFYGMNQSQITNEFTESSMTSVMDIIDYDFAKVGYRVSSNPKVQALTDSSITYLADLDNNGTPDSVKYFTRNSNGTKYLVRRTTTTQNKEFQLTIGNFQVRGYDSLNNVTLALSTIKSLEVQVVLDNNAFKTDNYSNYGSYYKRKYFIKN